MLNDRIIEVLDTIDVSNLDIANYIGYSPSIISRLRNGKVVPTYSSSSIRKFADGVIGYAKEYNCTYKLNNLLGERSLIDYLYQDESDYPVDPYNAPFSNFSERLGSLMHIANLNNSKLSRIINVDSSMISRLRNGHRKPDKNPFLIDTICQALIDEIVACNRVDELCSLIESEKSYSDEIDILYIHMRNWLCNMEILDKTIVNDLITTIDKFTPPDISTEQITNIDNIIPSDIINDTSSYYMGKKGLQIAVLRFLSAVISSNATEVLLFSDEDISWMTDDKDFSHKWIILMFLLIKNGIHIKIIHNINRNVNEMVSAIKTWMPLYMSGMISSYYNKRQGGTRFTHTLFVCPDIACIETFDASGNDNVLYEYHTDLLHIRHYANIWHTLYSGSETLIRLQTKNILPPLNNPSVNSYEINNIRITLKNSSVVITRTAPPYASFLILHPLMYDAFNSFIEQSKVSEQS